MTPRSPGLASRIDIAPAAWGALAVCATGGLTGYAGVLWGVGGTASVTLAVWWWVRSPGFSRRPRVVWGVVTVLAATRVVAAVGDARSQAAVWARLAERGAEIPVTATVVVDRARPRTGRWWFVRGPVAACAPTPCAGATIGWRWEGDERPRSGERWRLSGRLAPQPIDDARKRRYPPVGLVAGSRRGQLLEAELLERRDRAVPLLASIEGHLRERIEARFHATDSALVLALLIGDRSGLDVELYDAFATAGALHLLAVSGLHVGFLAWLLAAFLGSAGLDPRRRAAVATLVLAGYAALVGARPSVVRAATMATAVLWSHASERRVATWHVVGLAAIAIVAWRPLDVFDLGFSLSFGAVAGLLYWGRVTEIELPRLRRTPGAARGVRALVQSTVVTTAATLGTMPVVAAAFGWFAPAGFVTNPLAIPIVSAALPLAWVALGWDAVGVDVVAAPLAATTSVLLEALRWLVVETAQRSGVWIPAAVARIGIPMAAGAIAVGRRSARWASAALVLAVSLALTTDEASRYLEIEWLDVGQGDAVVLRFPNGATWLVDAGPAYPGGDAGHRVVVPHLRRAGATRLAWLITTHPDLDHVGGAAAVVEAFDVERWGGAGAVAGNTAYLSLLAARPPERVERLTEGRRLREGGVVVDVLHPPAEWVPDDPTLGGPSTNEGSVVLLIAYRDCRALLTGDAGRDSEERLVAEFGDSLRAGVLHVGHHGSRHSTTRRFLEAVRPTAAVVSVGRFNRHGHPHADVLARLERYGARVYRTDRSGRITARCTTAGWRLES